MFEEKRINYNTPMPPDDRYAYLFDPICGWRRWDTEKQGVFTPDLTMVGAMLRSLREERGLTQTALSERATVSRTYISLIERGHVMNITIRVLVHLTRALNVTPKWLFSCWIHNVNGI